MSVESEVSGDGLPAGLSGGVLGVGVALGVGEPEVEGGVGGSVEGGTVGSVVVPVAGDDPVAGVSVDERLVGDAGGQGVSEVDLAGGFSV